MSINKARGWMYWLVKLMGDIQAVTHKKPGKAIPKRIGRRIAGKGLGHMMRKVLPSTR